MRIKTTACLSLVVFVIGVGFFAADSVIASHELNPVPVAADAVLSSGQDPDQIALESYSVRGRLIGSVGVVRFRVKEGEKQNGVCVQMYRPFLQRGWKLTAIQPALKE